jgi:hypothetical protein
VHPLGDHVGLHNEAQPHISCDGKTMGGNENLMLTSPGYV